MYRLMYHLYVHFFFLSFHILIISVEISLDFGILLPPLAEA
jgi:hypothetical protein